MTTFSNDGKIAALFMFNHIITHFRVPQVIVIGHITHFQNHIMAKLSAKLGFHHENSSPYYHKANG